MKLVRAYFKMGKVISECFKMFCLVFPKPAFRTAMTMQYERTPVWLSPQDMHLQFYSPHRLPPHPCLPISCTPPLGLTTLALSYPPPWAEWCLAGSVLGRGDSSAGPGKVRHQRCCNGEGTACQRWSVAPVGGSGSTVQRWRCWSPKWPATVEGMPEKAPGWGDQCLSTSTLDGEISPKGVLGAHISCTPNVWSLSHLILKINNLIIQFVMKTSGEPKLF